MAVVRSIGPKVTQPVLYLDAVYGSIAAIITAVSRVDGSVSLITFPPGQAPAPQTVSNYDGTGVLVGRWRYHETDVV